MALAWIAAACGEPLPAQHSLEPLAELATAQAALPATATLDDGTVQPRFAVVIRQPTTLGVVDTGLMDARGQPVGIACATCHTAAARAPIAERAKLGGGFHRIELKHGGFDCNVCHAAADRTRLHLASEENVAFADVMRLCRQCHGPQYRDYTHGAHGGMSGHWDLTRGPRERNSCIICHAPHAPAYPQVTPAPPPRDRFFGPARDAQSALHGVVPDKR